MSSMAKRIIAFGGVFVFIVIVVWFGAGNMLAKVFSLAHSNDIEMEEEQEKSELAFNGCWFTKSAGLDSVKPEVIQQRQDREMNGYPTKIPLIEAIRIFNEEFRCYSKNSTFQPLTEEELIAVIIAGADYGKQGNIWLAQEKILHNIVLEKTMPKGSLLVWESGGRNVDSPLEQEPVDARGVRISLLLELDKNNRMEGILKPEQVLIIRKTFSGVDRLALK